MKILLVFLLAGFALAAASPLYDLGQVGGFGEFDDDIDYFSDDKHTLDEVKEKLKEKLENFLQKVRDALKGGKGIKDEILEKGKEIKEKFKLLKEQLDKDGKDFLEKLIDHGRDYLKQVFEKLGVNDMRAIDHHVEAIMQAEDKDGMIQKLKDRFQEVVKKVKDAIEQGKSLKDGLETLEKIRQKLKDFNIDLGDFGNDYLEQLKDKVKDYWQKLKDRLGVSKRNADIDVFGMVEELKRLIKEKFDPERLKAFIEKYVGENGEGKEIKEKLKLLKEQLDKYGKEFLKKLIDHVRDYLKQVFEKLGVNDKRSIDYHVEAIMQAEDKDGMIQKLKDRFQEVVKKVKDAIEQGKSLKDGLETLEKIRQKLKDFNIDLGDFGNDYLEQLKDKVKDYWQKLKDRLGVSKREANGDVIAMVLEFKKLINEEFDPERIKAFVEKYVGENKEMVEAVTQLIRENGKESLNKIREVLKKFIDHMIGAHSGSGNDVFEEIRDFFKDLGVEIKNRFAKFGEWVKEQYEKGLEKSKNRLQNIKTIAKEFLEDSKKISRDVAKEALQFFREYKKDLGLIFDDIEVKVKDILKQD